MNGDSHTGRGPTGPALARVAAVRRRPAAARRPSPARRAPARRRGGPGGRGRLLWLVAVLAAAGVAVVVFAAPFRDAVTEIRLPLKHEDIIRQQSREKGLDPALVAGVIYTESHFRDNQESSAGALGLMQITPETAADVAHQSGGSAFRTGDLHTAQVNISYGTFRLRYLLRRFGGDTTAALAAYNAGEGNVRRWEQRARDAGQRFGLGDIPFPETREYVTKVQSARRSYAHTYPHQLGLG